MGVRKHGLRVYVDVSSLKTASLATCGLSEKEQRQAQYIAAVDGSGLGVVLKDPTGPTGIIMPILEQPAPRLSKDGEDLAQHIARSIRDASERETIRMPSSLLKITPRGKP